MTFVRTVLGDIDPGSLGVTYAHEHLVIDEGNAVERWPDFLLSDVERMTAEVRSAAAVGLQAAVDGMPADCGRNARKLAEVSRRGGIHVIAATGLHHEKFYAPTHWSRRATDEEIATCSRRTSRTGSTSATTAARSSPAPTSGPGS